MLTITQRAKDFISNTGIPVIRFGARPNKGCAGFEYIWEEGTYIPNEDYRININDKFMLLVDVTQKKYIDCCEIDLVEDHQGILTKIEFRNTKTEVVCGCGESLNFDENIMVSLSETWDLAEVTNYKNDTVKNVVPNTLGNKYKRWVKE